MEETGGIASTTSIAKHLTLIVVLVAAVLAGAFILFAMNNFA